MKSQLTRLLNWCGLPEREESTAFIMCGVDANVVSPRTVINFAFTQVVVLYKYVLEEVLDVTACDRAGERESLFDIEARLVVSPTKSASSGNVCSISV